MKAAGKRGTPLIVMLLLASVLLCSVTCPITDIRSRVKTETAVTQYADSVKPFIFETNDTTAKVSLLLFIILFFPLLHVSGKRVSRKLLFTATQRHSVFSCISINAP